MPATPDYYKVLGVSPKADAEVIKKAYNKLARENHPDSHPGDKAREEKFKQVNQAHDVLGNPKKRKEYDAERTGATAGPRPPRTSPSDLSGYRRGSGYADTLRQPGARAGTTRTVPLPNSGLSTQDFLTPAKSLDHLKREARPLAREIAGQDSRWLHHGDLVKVKGVSYTFLRVKFNKPGDKRTFQSRDPLLCRGEAVLEAVPHVAAGQRLHAATVEDYNRFLQDAGEVQAEFIRLWMARNAVGTITAEIAALLEPGEVIRTTSGNYELTDIEVKNKSGAYRLAVIRKGNVIYSEVDGEPTNSSYIFANKGQCKEFGGAYAGIRGQAAKRAELRGVGISFKSVATATKNRAIAESIRVL